MPDLRARYKATRYGNAFKLPGAVTGVVPNVNTVKSPRRLLDANLQELLAPAQWWDAGTWVLAITSTVTGAYPVAPGAGVVPIVARITIGSGGVTHKLEVDAFPSATIQLPAMTVKVDIDWDDLPLANVLGLNVFKVPTEVTVRACVQRANIGTFARRSFLLQRQQGAAAVTTGIIPAFATRCMVYTNRLHQVYVAPASGLQLNEAGASPSLDLTNAELNTMRARGRDTPVPGCATNWQVTVGVAETAPARMNFLIRP